MSPVVPTHDVADMSNFLANKSCMDLGMNKYMLHQLPISLDKSCFEVMKGLSSQGSVIWEVSG